MRAVPGSPPHRLRRARQRREAGFQSMLTDVLGQCLPTPNLSRVAHILGFEQAQCTPRPWHHRRWLVLPVDDTDPPFSAAIGPIAKALATHFETLRESFQVGGSGWRCFRRQHIPKTIAPLELCFVER
jgi:hypothetical protein